MPVRTTACSPAWYRLSGAAPVASHQPPWSCQLAGGLQSLVRHGWLPSSSLQLLGGPLHLCRQHQRTGGELPPGSR